MLGARRLERLQALANELSLGDGAVVQTDVTRHEQLKHLVDHAVQTHGRSQRSGHIINVSSIAGHKVRPGSAVYSASKTAVRVISEGLRQEVNRRT